MNKFFLGLIVLILGGMVGWYVLSGGTEKKPSTSTTTVKTTPTSTTGGGLLRDTTGTSEMTPPEGEEKGGVASRSVVTYTATGFSPSPLTVKVGTMVTFVNESGKGMWVASAVHPTHQLLPGFDQLKNVTKGGTYEYTFVKVGTWKYHNHVAPGDTGSVVVTK